MKKIFVCSRYRGDVAHNTAIAEAICHKIIWEEKALPFAPHLYFTRFFDENVAEERLLGIAMGLEIMPHCQEVWVYEGDGVSKGMCLEIKQAHELRIPIRRLKKLD